jgi:hypothetical protein
MVNYQHHLAPDLAEIEKMADEHARLRQAHDDGDEARLAELAARIIDALSSEGFDFSLRDEALVNDGTTTYVYENGAAYPKLYDFLSEILHMPVPIVVNEAKFGPGEIIVGAGEKEQADAELRSAVKELQKLIHGKKTKATQ